MQESGYLKKLSDTQRNEILVSIANKGLCPSTKEVRLRSRDKKVFNKLAVNLVDFTISRSWKNAQLTRQIEANDIDVRDTFEFLTYGPEHGAWPIAAERNNDGVFDYFETVERVKQSIYFIFSYPAEMSFTRTMTNAVGMAGDSACHKFIFDDRFYSSEAQTDETISSQEILAIIAPNELIDEVRKIFHFVKLIIPVGNVEHTCSITRTNEKVFSYKILGPDYVTGLQEFYKQHSQIKKFGLHVVRLPTEMDMFTCYADLASREAILARYRATTLENALRKAAHAGNAADIHYIVKLGADVNAKDTEQNKRCALHWAIYHKRTSAIVALLMHNADRTVRDAQERDCNFYALSRNLDLTKLLEDSKSFAVQRTIHEQPKMDKKTGAKIMGTFMGPEFHDKLKSAIYKTTSEFFSSILHESLPAALRNTTNPEPRPVLYADCVWLIIENNGDVDIEAIAQATSTNMLANLDAINKPSIANVFTTSTEATECLRKIFESNSNANDLRQGHIINVMIPKDGFLTMSKLPDQELPKLDHLFTYTRDSLTQQRERAVHK